MWSGAFREYGWEESDLTRAITEHLTDPVMQKIAMEVLSDEQKEEEQEEMPLYEDNPLDLLCSLTLSWTKAGHCRA